MTAEKQQELGQTFLSVLSRPNADVIRSVAVDDFVWSFPGSSSISGEARGVEGVMKRAQTIASFGVKVEILRAVFGFSGVSFLLHNTANRDGQLLDEQVVAAFTFRGDKLARLDTYLSDVAMAERFFG
jgi:ketosteroid isomerase-like protein